MPSCGLAAKDIAPFAGNSALADPIADRASQVLRDARQVEDMSRLDGRSPIRDTNRKPRAAAAADPA